jgi:CubicO group peptidase (beta-lactamase class C family)
MTRHGALNPLRIIPWPAMIVGALLALSGAVRVCAAAAAASVSSAPTVNPPDCRSFGLSRCPRPFDEVLPKAQDMLLWDRDSRVIGFRNTYRLYPADAFHTRGATPYPLPPAAAPLPSVVYHLDGRRLSLHDFRRRQHLTGLLILKDGRVAYEYYGHGNTPSSLWTSRSVAKSVVSILVGIAIREGLIGSLDDPVVRYLPELAHTAWQAVSLRQLLQHSSGVAWNEQYDDPKSDFARLTRCEALPAPYACVLGLVSSRERRPGVQPGEVWSYNTGGAWLAGRVLEQATGMTLARYLETRLWSRFAMQSDGVWEALVPGRVDMGGHGFNATLRDWGRFGLFVANGGRLRDGEMLLPPDWIRESTRWTQARGSITPATPAGQYGLQWWNVGVDPVRADTDGAAQTAAESFWAEGIYGQSIALDPEARVVMVQWSTWDEAEKPDSLYDEQALFFNAVVRALAAVSAGPSASSRQHGTAPHPARAGPSP